MKQIKIYAKRIAALSLVFALTLPQAYGTAGESKQQTTIDLVEGLCYQNTITENNGKRVESYSFTLSPNSSAQAILLQGDETIYGGGTIERAVASAREQGYYVLGAINTDFFNTANGVPMGLVIENGVYKSGNYQENAMVIGENGVTLLEDPQITLTLFNSRTETTVTPHHYNKARSSTGGMYLLNEYFSGVSTRSEGAGWYVRFKLTDPADIPPQTEEKGNGSDFTYEIETDSSLVVSDEETIPYISDYFEDLTVNSTLMLTVTEVVHSETSLPMGTGEYILTADDASGYGELLESFRVGDRVMLTTTCEEPVLAEALWACGVGDIMVKDGELTDTASWTYNKDGRQPRTAVGIKSDGTLELYAVDGRQSSHSVGLTQLDLATELLARGCVWVANLDGGGSTALSAWLPGGKSVTVQNSPSDGKPRRCASYLLLVTQASDGTPTRLAFTEEGQTLLVGSSMNLPYTVTLDSALAYTNVETSDVMLTSLTGLGTVKENRYFAGPVAGTETLRLQEGELSGTTQLHIVDRLTELTLTRAGESEPLTALRVLTGGRIDLTVTGSYWNRLALRGFDGVEWTIEGDVGTVDETGRFVASRTPGEGSITCTAGGLSQTVAVTVVDRHSDIQVGHWAYKAVEFCYENGIVNGISLTEFGGSGSIRRADFVLMLYNAVGKPAVEEPCTFTDVAVGTYFYDAVAWAEQLGLATGIGDGRFAPADPVTREQAFTLFYRFLMSQEIPMATSDISVLQNYTDGDFVVGYAKLPVAAMIENGLVQGSNGCINPQNGLNRAEMAVLMERILNFAPDYFSCGDGEAGIPGVADAPEPEPEPPVIVEPEIPEETPEPKVHIGTVVGISSFLRVRAGAGSEYAVLGSLSVGAQVEIVGESGEWYEIRYLFDSGELGYVSKAYIEINESQA